MPVYARELRAGCGPVHGCGCGCASDPGSAQSNAEHDSEYRAFDLHASSEDSRRTRTGRASGDRSGGGALGRQWSLQANIGPPGCSLHHPNGGTRERGGRSQTGSCYRGAFGRLPADDAGDSHSGRRHRPRGGRRRPAGSSRPPARRSSGSRARPAPRCSSRACRRACRRTRSTRSARTRVVLKGPLGDAGRLRREERQRHAAQAVRDLRQHPPGARAARASSRPTPAAASTSSSSARTSRTSTPASSTCRRPASPSA